MSSFETRTAAVIGAAGRVGLATALTLTRAGFRVLGIDTDRERSALIAAGTMPFREQGGAELLAAALSSGRLTMDARLSDVRLARQVVVVVGTSLDQRRSPDLEQLYGLVDDLAPCLRPGHLVALRSTTPPGAADRIRGRLERGSGLAEGRDFHLVYAPERAREGYVIAEQASLPQLIGAFSPEGYRQASEFFAAFASGDSVMLTPVEAELGKLIANAARYVSFALANECWLIGNQYGVNINHVIDACNYRYPRLDLPGPGPNVGGPCLYKDGWFLLERIPFPDLFGAAFRINESMPMQVAQLLENRVDGDAGRVGVLGLTFKADSDDLRDSLSRALLRRLEERGYECVAVEPNLADGAPLSALRGCGAVVLMTPHQEFKDLRGVMAAVDNPRCVYLDLWGFWDDMRHASANGVFRGADVPKQEV